MPNPIVTKSNKVFFLWAFLFDVSKTNNLVVFLSLIFLLDASFSFCQQTEKAVLSGKIKDAANGEDIIGATIFLKEINNGIVTNEYGFYSITVPKGKYTVNISYLGFAVQERIIELNQNTKLDIELAADTAQLEEVVVTGEKEDKNVKDIRMSTVEVDIKQIRKMPALLGEVDVIRSIQLLPGVSTVGEGASGFNVRGGSIDQNLVLLDEAPVYNSSHLFGFFSVFNPDAVKDVRLIKGGIPSQYGGRLSSILDVRLKEGNNKKLSGAGGVGLIFSRLTVEAPIVKDKGSFIVAARRSYIDILAKPFLPSTLEGSKFYFYDLTIKANYTLGL
ncbi:MAG TPA: TonB-dependent receptor, partial [Cytophagaceae bacterium]